MPPYPPFPDTEKEGPACDCWARGEPHPSYLLRRHRGSASGINLAFLAGDKALDFASPDQGAYIWVFGKAKKSPPKITLQRARCRSGQDSTSAEHQPYGQ